jgi:hypothetical protein
MVARLLLRLAEHPDWLRDRAMERLDWIASYLGELPAPEEARKVA